MKSIRIFRHIDCEGPGFLSDVLDAARVPYQVVAIDRGEPIPQDLDEVAGLVFMGGPMSANDDLPWVKAELELIRWAAERHLPILGHCLGGQLISKALGSVVQPNPVREIGWHSVRRIDNDASGDWLGGLPERFQAFHWHGETFSIPEGATAMLKSDYCARQAFAVDNILALQCHIEMTASLVEEWAQRYAHEIAEGSASVQDEAEMTRALGARIEALNRIAEPLYRRWLRPILDA